MVSLLLGAAVALFPLSVVQASSVYSWSGSASALWSNPGNWSPNGLPANGDTLAFPAGASNLTNTNDLAAGTSFASLVFNGVGYTLNGNGIALTGSLTANAGTTAINLPIDVGSGSVTIDGADLLLGGSLSGSGSIDIALNYSNGVEIAASGSYTGTITNNGNLTIDSVSIPLSAIVNNNFFHLNGASLPATTVTHSSSSYALFGSGTIGSLTATSPVHPGSNYSCGYVDAPGLLNTGNLSLAAQGCFTLSGASAGTGYSQINTTGSVSLGAGSSLSVVLSPSFVPAPGQPFMLIKNDAADAVSGTFNGLPEGSIVTLNALYQFKLSYVGGDGNDVVLTCITAPRAWTGATNALWSNPNNWTPSSVPQAGETLLFPSGASNLTNTNDLAAGTSFASLVFNGVGYTLNGNGIALTGSLTANAGTTAINLPIDVGSGSVTIDGADLLLGGSLSGSGSIDIALNYSNGVRIAASGSYTGTITNNGNLTIDSVSIPLSAIVNNNFFHLNGASLPATTVTHSSSSYALFGSGTIGSLTATSPVHPGSNYSCGYVDAPGLLNTGNLSLAAQGCFTLSGASAGTGYSQINTTGSVSLGAGSSLSVVLSPSFVPAPGQPFMLIKNDAADAVSGTFNGLPEGSIVTLNALYQFKLSYVGGDGNDVVLTCITAPRAWTGATNALWSNPNNWTPSSVPQAGETLLFPSGASNLTNTNDLAAGTSFASLVFNGVGYTLNGNGIALTGSLTANAGTTAINLPIDVGSGSVTIDGADLLLGGSLSGSGSIDIALNYSNGVRIAASGSYTGTITNSGNLTIDSVSMPVSAIVNNNVFHLNGASLPATTVTHSSSSYALFGSGTIGSLTATSPVHPGSNYSCGYVDAPGLLNTGNLSLAAQGCFTLSGASPGTGYSQINTTGSVSLGAGSSLSVVLSPSFVPSLGQPFMLIKNDAADGISGTFNGQPEGSIITLNSVYQFQLSYVGGDGNDVVLTSLNGLALPTTSLTSTPNPSTPSQSVTFTATVLGSGPTATGTVTFFDASSMLGSGTLNGAGVATYSTALLTVGTHSIIAQYNSDSNYGGSVSSVLTQVVGQASQFLVFDPAPTVVVGGTGTAHATSSLPNSGNPIQYSTLSMNCSVNSVNGVVTGIHAGTNNCTITATQTGDSNYLQGMATQILSIGQASQTIASFIAIPANPVYASGPFTVSATGGASGNPVMFSIAPASAGVCSAGGIQGAIITIITAGSCTVLADQNGSADFAAAPQASLVVPIARAAATIVFDNLSFIYDGATKPITAHIAEEPATICAVAPAAVGPNAGSYSVSVASCTGTNYAGGGSDTAVIAKAASTLNLSSACMSTFVESQPYTYSALINGINVTGTVTFDDGNAVVLCSNVAVSGNAAACMSSALNSSSAMVTNYLLGASYSGDGNHYPGAAVSPLAVSALSMLDVIFRDGFELVTGSCPVE